MGSSKHLGLQLNLQLKIMFQFGIDLLRNSLTYIVSHILLHSEVIELKPQKFYRSPKMAMNGASRASHIDPKFACSQPTSTLLEHDLITTKDDQDD